MEVLIDPFDDFGGSAPSRFAHANGTRRHYTPLIKHSSAPSPHRHARAPAVAAHRRTRQKLVAFVDDLINFSTSGLKERDRRRPLARGGHHAGTALARRLVPRRRPDDRCYCGLGCSFFRLFQNRTGAPSASTHPGTVRRRRVFETSRRCSRTIAAIHFQAD